MKTVASAALVVSLLTGLLLGGASAEKRIEVYVALCDNATQAIAPVPPKIGDGDVPAANLYWGCSDGLSSLFKKSKNWQLIKSERDTSLEPVLERLTFRHRRSKCTLVAHAYRGSKIQICLRDYYRAIAERKAGLICYVGHNGLMEFDIDPPKPKAAPAGAKPVAAISLCCDSLNYFKEPLKALGAEPVLLTQQLMYPGSFVIHDVAERWLAGGSPADFRAAAGRGMAKNQKISVKAATGIFAPVEKL